VLFITLCFFIFLIGNSNPCVRRIHPEDNFQVNPFVAVYHYPGEKVLYKLSGILELIENSF